MLLLEKGAKTSDVHLKIIQKHEGIDKLTATDGDEINKLFSMSTPFHKSTKELDFSLILWEIRFPFFTSMQFLYCTREAFENN